MARCGGKCCASHIWCWPTSVAMIALPLVSRQMSLITCAAYRWPLSGSAWMSRTAVSPFIDAI